MKFFNRQWRAFASIRGFVPERFIMPELPEVETMRRGVAGIAGATIIAAERTPCPKRPIQIKPRIDHLNKRVAGVVIASVDRLGKRVVIRMETGDRIIMEPRMTGLVLVTEPPTQEHLRFRLRLKKCKHKELLFWDRRGLGQIALLSDAQYQAKLNDGSLGPDALEISRQEFPGRFNKSRRVKSKSPCLSNLASLASAIFTHLRFYIWPACIRRLVVIGFRQSSGIEFSNIRSTFWKPQSATKAQRSRMARIATRSMMKAVTKTNIGFTIEQERSVRRAARETCCESCRHSDRRFTARRCQKKR